MFENCSTYIGISNQQNLPYFCNLDLGTHAYPDDLLLTNNSVIVVVFFPFFLILLLLSFRFDTHNILSSDQEDLIEGIRWLKIPVFCLIYNYCLWIYDSLKRERDSENEPFANVEGTSPRKLYVTVSAPAEKFYPMRGSGDPVNINQQLSLSQNLTVVW